jgi:tetratricopeptide (TPR) repeat protein
VKLTLLATSIAFWWYCNAVVGNMLVGIALFEIFHDVQYLAIVWVYNRRRVEGDPNVGAFTRFLFRSRRWWMLLYVGMVFAYGSLSLLPKLPSETVNAVFTAILAASTLLHFYYDSFIWKLREKPTRATLGLEGGQEIAAPHRNVRRWFPQGLRWAALVVPAAYLAVAGARPRMSQDEAMQELGRTFVDYPLAQNNLAVFLLKNNDADGAIRVSRHVLSLHPRGADLQRKARSNLLWALVGAGLQRVQYGSATEAQSLLQEAVRLEPDLVGVLAREGARLAQSGKHGPAIVHYRAALLLAPNDASLHLSLAEELFAHRSLDAAFEHARIARHLRPTDPASARLIAALEAARSAGG